MCENISVKEAGTLRVKLCMDLLTFYLLGL